MTKWRKLFVLLMIFGLIAAACGNDDDGDSTATDSEAEATEEPAAEEEATEEATEEPAAEEEATEEAGGTTEVAACGANTPEGELPQGVDVESGVVKLGTSEPFTGTASVAGEGLLAGIQIAVDEINAAGGIDGCTFELVWLDDRFEIEQMVTNIRRLIDEEQVWAIVSPAGSQAIPGSYEFIIDADMPMWAPVSPADQDIQQVYLLGPTRTEQGRICVDYFNEQGATTVAAIGQNNELGEEAFAAVDLQGPINGMEVVAKEEVEVLSENVSPAVLAVIDSGAEAVLTAVDNAQNALILDQFNEAGFDVLVCSDQGAAGAGGPNTVGAATPEGADGYLGALQNALTDVDDPFVNEWRELAEAYDGPGADGALNFNLQTYAYTRAFFDLFDRLDGDLSRANFHGTAESLVDDPIDISAIPTVACGALPGGHSCAKGAGLAEYQSDTETWVQVRDFLPPNE